jgi:hypothetical protein
MAKGEAERNTGVNVPPVEHEVPLSHTNHGSTGIPASSLCVGDTTIIPNPVQHRQRCRVSPFQCSGSNSGLLPCEFSDLLVQSLPGRLAARHTPPYGFSPNLTIWRVQMQRNVLF